MEKKKISDVFQVLHQTGDMCTSTTAFIASETTWHVSSSLVYSISSTTQAALPPQPQSFCPLTWKKCISVSCPDGLLARRRPTVSGCRTGHMECF